MTWAASVLARELDTHGFLYEVEWVEDWGLEMLLDECARPRKQKMVRVQCSCCGYQDLYHYGRGQKGYGFVLPESLTEVEGGTVYEDGDNILCPSCECPVQIRRKASLRQKGYVISAENRAMSAAVVGEDHLLVLTGWVIQRRVFFGGGERLEAIPGEAYVFSAGKCTQLMGWVNSYSGTAGYYIQYTRDWRQPRAWHTQWGQEEYIFGLTPQLIAESCLPHCKLDVYMERRPGAYHYPVTYLRLCQVHPNMESVLLHGLPRVLDDLIGEYAHAEVVAGRHARPELSELDWSQTRPAQILRLTRDELSMARAQSWGVLFWRLFTGAKALGEHLSEGDIRNAFCLGDEHVTELVGRGPVGKSLRYLLHQCELAGVEDDGEDPDPNDVIDVQTLLDYWGMAELAGCHLDDPAVRWPRCLPEAHDRMAVLAADREDKCLAGNFRIRRKQLARYAFRFGDLLIRPAKSQRELKEEGEQLNHCVATYGKRHANGETAIFFIRRRSKPGIPYYTLELNENTLTVRQNRGKRNCPRTPEVQDFEHLWVTWLHAGAPRDQAGSPVIMDMEVVVA